VFFREFSAKSDSNFAQISKFMKKILSVFLIKSYERQITGNSLNFRIKRASISNYGGRYMKYIVCCEALNGDCARPAEGKSKRQNEKLFGM
jgi:hypothetical protein